MTDARVRLWGRTVGAVSWDAQRGLGVFQYAPKFLGSPVEPSPIVMPKALTSYDFPDTYHGLPGLLSDSIPDKFGNALIDRWLASQGREADSMDPVERLCYVGKRGMGALEYEPAIRKGLGRTTDVQVSVLLEQLNDNTSGLEQILPVGTSAGGARAKAVLVWNPKTGAFKSGQLSAPPGYEHWLLKFDGVSDPRGYGRIEYAYYLMARSCGIEMMPSRLHEEGGRAHFMTRRFDRVGDSRSHVQSLCALCHYDFNQARAYSYEQAIQACRMLKLGTQAIEQQVRRAFFNVLARNQDDHTRNIAFMMDKAGRWRLSPAFDVAYAFNPEKSCTREHQMSLNEKTDHFEKDDLMAFAKFAGLKKPRALKVLENISTAVAGWAAFARDAEVTAQRTAQISSAHRSDLLV